MRVAVVGMGSAGRRHAENAVALGHEVVAFDPGVSDDGPWTRAVDVAGAIAAAEVVVVASPSALHAEHATAALDAGRPVLIEKPMATGVADAERIADAARRAGVTCAVAMNLRFHAGVRELKRLVESGELGSIRIARASFGYDLARWRPGTDYRQSYSARAELGGGIVLDAIHELDYLQWLLGDVVAVDAETAHLSDLEVDVEDSAVALLRFSSGVLATVDLNFHEAAYRRGCLLVGSKATAEWNWTGETVKIAFEEGGARAERTRSVPCSVAETYVTELEDFVSAVADSRPPATGVDEGVAAVRLANAITLAAREGRRVDPNA